MDLDRLSPSLPGCSARQLDLTAAIIAIQSQDVVLVRFRTGVSRLVIDTRPDSENGPILGLIPPVHTVERLFLLVRELRPTLSAPEEFVTFQWTGSIGGLEESALWKTIRRKVAAGDRWKGAANCTKVLERLYREERQLIDDALTDSSDWRFRVTGN